MYTGIIMEALSQIKKYEATYERVFIYMYSTCIYVLATTMMILNTKYRVFLINAHQYFVGVHVQTH